MLCVSNQAERRKKKEEEDEDTISDFVRTRILCDISEFVLDCPALIETVKQPAYYINRFFVFFWGGVLLCKIISFSSRCHVFL